MIEVIAEAGSNHNGDPNMAKKLVMLAKKAGASSVKFQFIFPDGLYIPKFYEEGVYQDNQAYTRRISEQLSENEWRDVWDYAKKINMPISASVFCKDGIQLLKKLGAPYVKIASTDLTNHQLIYDACLAFPEVIISTGMATLAEIEGSMNAIRAKNLKTRVRLMHCVSAYPCPIEHANTQRIRLLADSFGLDIGYSDHTEGNEAAVMALVTGATFFEKHFTIDRTMTGFDHAHAMEEIDLTRYVTVLRAASNSLKTPPNQLSDLELTTKTRARRGVYAAKSLKAGHVLTSDDLLFVRPSTTSSVNSVEMLIGETLASDCEQYEPLGQNSSVVPVTSNWQAAMGYWLKEMRDKKMLKNDEACN